jgi:MFS transporter, ACDE family, multidrug resistance protein
MITPRAPIFLSHAPTPKVAHFAALAALEAGVRGTIMSTMPLVILDAMGSEEASSAIYFVTGVLSLIAGLMLPFASRFIPRRWLMTGSGALYLVGLGLAASGLPGLAPFALIVNAVATVTFTICLSAYVLDFIAREELGRNESTRMLFSALPWAVGPALGVFLHDWWGPAPFILSGLCAIAMVALFWILRLGNGRKIQRARGPAANPLAYLGRFFRQPRLVAGWLFASIRSCGWWVYVVYLPYFCIDAGLGNKVAGVAASLSNAFLLTTPLMLRLVHRWGVRRSVRQTFAVTGILFVAAALLSGWPWATVILLGLGSVGLVMLDVCGGLPFLMAVKPSERTEMAAVYASFRDVSGIVTPATGTALLLLGPIASVFAAAGLGMGAAWAVAGRLHPRLGARRRGRG